MSGNPYDIGSLVASGPEAPAATEAVGAPETVPPAPETKRRGRSVQVARANVMLILLFLGGGAAVYGLSLRNGQTEDSEAQKLAEAQVDSALLRISQMPSGEEGRPAAGRTTRKLLEGMYAEVTGRQVPLSRLRKNPFVMVLPRAPVATGPKTPRSRSDGQTKAEREEQQTLQDALARMRALRLQSIMMGGRAGATAIISNNLVTAGQKLDGFTVRRITPKTAVLTWRDQTFTLEME